MKYQENKELLVERAKSHRKADTIIQGEYWDGSKGCCVGCLAETSDEPHEKLSSLTGAPEWLFRLADKIHEGLTEEDSKDWVVDFSQALAVTTDDKKFWKDTDSHWKIACMHECLRNKDFWFENDKDDVYASKVVAVLELVKELASKELSCEEVDWYDAKSARFAAWSAKSNDWFASWSAKSTDWSDRFASWSAKSAVESAESAGWSAKFTDWSAGWSAKSAGWSDSSTAWSASSAAWSTAWSAGWSVSSSAAYKRLSEELITILRREEVKK